MRTTGGPPIDWEYFEKAYNKNKNQREINWDNLRYIDDELNKMGYSLPQRQAIIYNIYQESGGNPAAMSKDNRFAGLLQWATAPGDRYSKISDRSLRGQVRYLDDTLYGPYAFNGQNWMGMDRQATRANQTKFTNAKNAQTAMSVFTRGYVRPNPEVSANRMANFSTYFPNEYDRYGNAASGYNTRLTPNEEMRFLEWRSKLPLQLRSDYDYDLRGAFINGYNPDENGHMTDLFKKPNHPTFSVESYYSDKNHVGGTWDGEDFTPSEWNRKQTSVEPVPPGVDFYYNSGPTLLPVGYTDGGKIHIKKENRGKFTALKERTGHSATWFKQNGTPAQKKMATFALNAAKWKHK